MGDVQKVQLVERGFFFCRYRISSSYGVFVDQLQQHDVLGMGKKIRHDVQRYPKGTNVNFVQGLAKITFKSEPSNVGWKMKPFPVEPG